MKKTDLEILSELNHDYIESVQHSDVDRFKQLLSDDFRCSNPDGSIVNRDGFLDQTAKPMAVTDLKAKDVEIRIMGSFAIIHARTVYNDANGISHSGRYTDVWAKVNDHWRAVSAHVTRA